jgi:hypothetical protein
MTVWYRKAIEFVCRVHQQSTITYVVLVKGKVRFTASLTASAKEKKVCISVREAEIPIRLVNTCDSQPFEMLRRPPQPRDIS